MISSTAAKVVAGVAILLTVVLAVVGYRVSREYAETSERAQNPAREPVVAAQQEDSAPKILAVVATKPLAAYQPIPKDDVVLAEVSVAPRAYFTSLEDVVGKQPLVDIDQGAPVTQRYFAEGNVLAKSVPPGFQAISVEVTDVIGVGGFVRPGDIVDVLLYLRGGQDVDDAQARVLLEETRVLAYHELLVDRPEGLRENEGSQQSSRRQRTAVLAVPDKDTTRLMLGASMGPDYTRFRDPTMIRPGEQTLIQVDVDPRNAGWVYPVDQAITADIRDVIPMLHEIGLAAEDREARIAAIRELKVRTKYDELPDLPAAQGTRWATGRLFRRPAHFRRRR